ncbi:MAG: hypothetical protein ACOC2U_04145 [bacterium]
MSSNSKIPKTFAEINQYFKENNIDNKLLVLDFSHFTKIDKDHCNIKTEFFGFKKQVNDYNQALEEAAESTNVWKKFEEDNVRLTVDYGEKKDSSEENESALLEKPFPQFFHNKISENSFSPDEVIKGLKKNKVGSCIMFVSKSFSNDEAQSIVYATFKNRIFETKDPDKSKNREKYQSFDYKKNDKSKLSPKEAGILEKCFNDLESLLLNEMIHSLYETGLKKERQSTFNNIWHNTNHLLGAIRSRAITVEKEIIKNSPDFFKIKCNKISSDLDFSMSQMNFLRNIENLGKPGSYYFDADGKIRQEISIEKINIKHFVEKITDNLKINIANHKADTIRPLSSMYKRLFNNLTDLYLTEKVNESFVLTIEKHPLYNILIDILVNATKFACNPAKECKPKVTIWSSKTSPYITNLHIRNESSIGLKEWNYWMTDEEEKSVESHLGIRLSKYIMDYYKIKYCIPENCIREKGGYYTEVIISLNNEYYPVLNN